MMRLRITDCGLRIGNQIGNRRLSIYHRSSAARLALQPNRLRDDFESSPLNPQSVIRNPQYE
jgi:hypothetical protein